jgi:hypothetical protein
VALQFEHRLSQLLYRDRPAVPVMADIEILAEDAAEVAAGKEYRPRAANSDQDAFLAKVRADGADDRLLPDAAKASLALSAASSAPTGTELARVH